MQKNEKEERKMEEGKCKSGRITKKKKMENEEELEGGKYNSK